MSKIQIDEKVAKIYRDKWYAISIDTTKTNKQKARKAIKDIYKAKGLDTPKILFVDNPSYGIRIAEYAMNNTRSVKQVMEFIKKGEYKTKKAKVVDLHGLGQQDASWLVYWDYLIDNHRDLVEKDIPVIVPTMELSKEVNCYWLLDKMAIVTVKPEIFSFVNGKFHSTTGPAIKFKNYELYLLNGKEFTKKQWQQKVKSL